MKYDRNYTGRVQPERGLIVRDTNGGLRVYLVLGDGRFLPFRCQFIDEDRVELLSFSASPLRSRDRDVVPEGWTVVGKVTEE